MTSVDLVDETFISSPPHAVSAVVAQRDRWPVWFPEMSLTIFMDRGESGIRWSVTGSFVGSMELWLEPFGDGVIVHYYLRVEPSRRGSATEVEPLARDRAGWRQAAKMRTAKAKAWKRIVWELKDELEGSRAAGDPALVS